MRQKLDTHIRWILRRDLPTVLSIEQRHNYERWERSDFISCFKTRTIIGMLAESDESIVGYMVYELQQFRINILKMSVHPDFVRQGVGASMVESLKEKVNRNKYRKHLRMSVCETNLSAQLFLKSQGFIAISLLRDDDSGYDRYLMQWTKGE